MSYPSFLYSTSALTLTFSLFASFQLLAMTEEDDREKKVKTVSFTTFSSSSSQPIKSTDFSLTSKSSSSLILSKKEDDQTSSKKRKDLTLNTNHILKVNTKVPIKTSDNQELYELIISGENNGCAVYSLGFRNHTEAREALLAHSDDENVRKLALPEIIADLAETGSASRFIKESPTYQALVEIVNTSEVNLNQEAQQLSRKLNNKGTATHDQLLSSSLDLTEYNKRYEKKTLADGALKKFLTSKVVFEGFVKSSVKDGVMQTYTPDATTLLDALAYIQGENLVIMGRNLQGNLAVLRQSIWNSSWKTRTSTPHPI